MAMMNRVVGYLAAARILYERLKANSGVYTGMKVFGRCLLIALIVVAYTLAIGRYEQKKALDLYYDWIDAYQAEQERLAQEAYESDPYTIQLNEEAEQLARVLYGVKDNKTDDLRTYCWCVFNRVDSKSYPATLADVIAQPNQWMRYDQTNPVLENLFELAREELDRWHTDSHRPVSSDYVFMSWSSNDICLRDNFAEGSGTHYWRYGQK